METLIDLLKESVATHGGRKALVMRKGFRNDTWSYDQLWRNAKSAAYYFRFECGLKPGDRIIVKAANSPQWVASFLGAMMARIIWVPLDPFSTNTFIKSVIQKVQPSGILTDDQPWELVGIKWIRLCRVPFDRDFPEIKDHPEAEDTVEIVFTSGTTSSPKGVVLSHKNILSNVMSAKDILPGKRPWRILSILPLSHMFEQTCGLLLPLYLGLAIYYQLGQKPMHIKKALKRYEINIMIVVPQLLEMLMKEIEREARRKRSWKKWRVLLALAGFLPFKVRRFIFRRIHAELGGSLEFIFSGGASLPPEIKCSWNRIGVKIIEGYGATECSPIITFKDYKNQIAGSVGKPLPGITVTIGDHNEIWVKGANVMREYWRDSEATQAVFTHEGWYRTGDKGTQDSHGNIYVQGRIKNMIVLPNGLNVYPEDVEAVLDKQDEIRECVVCGIGAPLNGVKLTAVVIPSDVMDDSLSEKDFVSVAIKKVNAQLAPHQRIAELHVWKGEKLPKTGLGKVKRQEILRSLKKGNNAESRPEVCNAGKDPWISVQKILAQISGVDPANIIPSSDLDLDLGLSSLSLVEATLMIEEEFGISLDDDELFQLKTVGRLFDFIQRGVSTEKPLLMPTWSLKESARMVRNFIQQILFFPLHKALARPFSVVGAEQLTRLQSPALFVANHCSHVDTLSISRALFPYLKGRLAVAAAADYFYRNKIFGALASLLLNTFPLPRQGAVRASLEHCADLVENGWSILIYPEGTRSRTGELLPFKKGAGLLASELKIPVVPIGILGSHKILPKGKTIPKPGPILITIGPPIKVSQNMSPEAALFMFRNAIKDLLRSTDLKFCERKFHIVSDANFPNKNDVKIPDAHWKKKSPTISSRKMS